MTIGNGCIVLCVELVDAGVSAGKTDTMERLETEQLGRELKSHLGSHDSEQLTRDDRKELSSSDPTTVEVEDDKRQRKQLIKIQPATTVVQRHKTYFTCHQSNGTIDVWWLYDDGGKYNLLHGFGGLAQACIWQHYVM